MSSHCTRKKGRDEMIHGIDRPQEDRPSLQGIDDEQLKIKDWISG